MYAPLEQQISLIIFSYLPYSIFLFIYLFIYILWSIFEMDRHGLRKRKKLIILHFLMFIFIGALFITKTIIGFVTNSVIFFSCVPVHVVLAVVIDNTADRLELPDYAASNWCVNTNATRRPRRPHNCRRLPRQRLRLRNGFVR